MLKNGDEFVFRQESIKNLSGFLSGNSKQIFKGRLQLFKSGEVISVQVKVETIGEIAIRNFQNYYRLPAL